MRYQDCEFTGGPRAGATLPAFVISSYEEGHDLIFSHGGFDIWCVYDSTECSAGASSRPPAAQSYPLELTELTVKKVTGSKTDFIGSFADEPSVEYSFSAPKDVDYMQQIRDLGSKEGQNAAWRSFSELYESIPQKKDIWLTRDMTDKVRDIANQYPNEPDLRFTLDCLLAAMIAENNRLKKYGSPYDTKLGKKVKALGVYQAIYETDMAIWDVANFSKGLKWFQINSECARRGIKTPNL